MAFKRVYNETGKTSSERATECGGGEAGSVSEPGGTRPDCFCERRSKKYHNNNKHRKADRPWHWKVPVSCFLILFFFFSIHRRNQSIRSWFKMPGSLPFIIIRSLAPRTQQVPTTYTRGSGKCMRQFKNCKSTRRECKPDVTAEG